MAYNSRYTSLVFSEIQDFRMSRACGSVPAFGLPETHGNLTMINVSATAPAIRYSRSLAAVLVIGCWLQDARQIVTVIPFLGALLESEVMFKVKSCRPVTGMPLIIFRFHGRPVVSARDGPLNSTWKHMIQSVGVFRMGADGQHASVAKDTCGDGCRSGHHATGHASFRDFRCKGCPFLIVRNLIIVSRRQKWPLMVVDKGFGSLESQLFCRSSRCL